MCSLVRYFIVSLHLLYYFPCHHSSGYAYSVFCGMVLSNMTEQIPTQTPSPEHQDNLDLFEGIDQIQKKQEAEALASQQVAAEFQVNIDAASQPLEAAKQPANFIKQAAKASVAVSLLAGAGYAGASLAEPAVESIVDHQEKIGQDVQEMADESERQAFEQGIENGSVQINVPQETVEQLPSPVQPAPVKTIQPPTIPSPVTR